MCVVCGCGADRARDQGRSHRHDHGDEHVRAHGHAHDHAHDRGAGDGRSPGSEQGGAGRSLLDAVHVPETPATRIIQVEQDLLAENERYATANRAVLAARGAFAVNLMSGPGAGKTTLLTRTIADLRNRMAVAVIEGDQQTALDAERIRAAGADAVQINTGKGCHLDAHMVGHALERLSPNPGGLLVIENVGNLVCPAAFDLGETVRVVLLSVTEGDDKPLKYPDMFATADLAVISKVDLLPHVPFDLAHCTSLLYRIRPEIEVLALSATTGEGLAAWYAWIERRRTAVAPGREPELCRQP